jgi:hypothetical protein
MQIFKINRLKAEAPLMAAFFIFSMIVSLIFYPMIMIWAFLIFPLMAITYIILRKFKLGFFKNEAFLILDDEGMRYSFHLLQSPKLLRWDLVEKVNFQLYEVNFRLKLSGEVISLQKGYFDDPEDVKEFRKMVLQYCDIV